MTDKSEIFIPSNAARASLAQKLNLEFKEGMQDWEYEVSNYQRMSDFFDEYDKPETTDNEKMSLMEIIFDCLNELLRDEKKLEFEQYFNMVQARIRKSKDLHSGTLNYWVKNDFEISTEIQKLVVTKY